jgi:hypothetical protein
MPEAWTCRGGFNEVRGEWSLMALCYNFTRVLNIVGQISTAIRSDIVHAKQRPIRRVGCFEKLCSTPSDKP